MHDVSTKVSGPKRKQRGIALLICLFALLLVTGIALAMLNSSDTETAVNKNYRESQEAYFGAEAGINEAIDRIELGLAGAANGIVAPTVMPSATGGVTYIINKKSAAEVVTPWTLGSQFMDTELCKENFFPTVVNNLTGAVCAALPTGSTWYTSVNSYSPFTGTSAALNYKWVRITLKGNSTTYPYFANGSNLAATAATQVCSSGPTQAMLPSTATTCPNASMQPVFVITSLAVTNRGTRRMLQSEYTKISMPPFPSALTLDGPGSSLVPPYDAPNSNPFHINGNDQGGCGGGNHPAVGTTDSPTRTQVIGAIPANRLDHYTGVDGTTPDVTVITPVGTAPAPNTIPGLDPTWTSPSQIESLASTLAAAANPSNVYQGNQTDINIGSQASPQITFVNGDLTMTGSTRGGGILIVTGTLTMSGNSGFYGVVLAIGKGVFQANGGGNGEYDGSILVAHTRDANGNVLPNLADPVVNWSGGGGNGVYYNSCAIQSAQQSLGLIRMSQRELTY